MQSASHTNSNQSADRQRARIGFVLSHEQFPVPELLELGQAAERAGFDAVWASDHFHPWQDNQGHAGSAWITLAALGQRASRLTMGTGVTCPSYRYRPAIVAQSFATLGQLYPGRIFLGTGSGEAVNEVPPGGGWGDYDERAERLIEAVEIIRRLWTGEWVDYQGKYYRIEHARLYDLPPVPVPLYIAAAGARSARLAGEHGDGWITNAENLSDQHLRSAFEEGARAGGKDPRSMSIVVEHFVIVGDKAEADRWTPLWRFVPKTKPLTQVPDPIEIQRRAEQEVPLEQVYSGWPVSPDPQVHAQALQKLIDNGATYIFVHSPQGDQRRVVEFYGHEVLPRLQREKVPQLR